VDLNEVVRCSERVVLAAMAFQAGGVKRIGETKSMSTVGPRPASFIFDVEGGEVARRGSENETQIRK
jgi:hypothetical protein